MDTTCDPFCRAYLCLPYSVSSLWSPFSEDLELGRQTRSCVESCFLRISYRRFPCTLMMLPCLCHAVQTWLRCTRCLQRARSYQGSKLIWEREVYGWTWKFGVYLPIPFRWSDRPIRILGGWLVVSKTIARN